eukprot:1040061-Rhodomonas_salina.2
MLLRTSYALPRTESEYAATAQRGTESGYVLAHCPVQRAGMLLRAARRRLDKNLLTDLFERVHVCPMSGTGVAYAAMRCPRTRLAAYAMSGTGIGYSCICVRCAVCAYGATRSCSTERGYGATRCPVLSAGMVLPGATAALRAGWARAH